MDANGLITESKFKTFGCGSAIASSSLATEWVKGKTLDEVLAIKNKDIAGYLKVLSCKEGEHGSIASLLHRFTAIA